jgi:hypothetical protein
MMMMMNVDDDDVDDDDHDADEGHARSLEQQEQRVVTVAVVVTPMRFAVQARHHWNQNQLWVPEPDLYEAFQLNRRGLLERVGALRGNELNTLLQARDKEGSRRIQQHTIQNRI